MRRRTYFACLDWCKKFAPEASKPEPRHAPGAVSEAVMAAGPVAEAAAPMAAAPAAAAPFNVSATPVGGLVDRGVW
jgi:hypothetical protein